MKGRNGFTLIELLIVITMIALLMGMITGALYQARLAVKKTRAEVQLRDLIAAWGEYYLVEEQLPSGMGGGWTPMTRETLSPLITPNSQGFVYLNLNDAHFKNGQYVDPWGSTYAVRRNASEVTPGETQNRLVIKASVSFINHKRE